jgi:periplasmic protein TonB
MSAHTAERRPLGALGRMGVVAAMHVGVLYLIADSMGIVPSILPAKTEITIIDEAPPPDEVLPPPQPVDFTRADTVVLPDPPLDLVYEPADVITGPPPDVVESRVDGGSAVVQPFIVGVSQDSRYPLSQPPYPPSEVRAGNTGTTEIEVYVLPNGRVGDARIVKSTGFEALDRSALEEAKRKWRLTPATQDGVPFAQWHRLKVTFKLNQQR